MAGAAEVYELSEQLKGDITKADVIDMFAELTDVLTAYADRIDREIELIVRPDGTAALMGGGRTCLAGEPADYFEEIASFDNFVDLWSHLTAGEDADPGVEEESAEEIEC